MRHKTTERFWKCFAKAPNNIQELAKENFELLKNDPKHPSLHFKNHGKFWSTRIGLNYRALAIQDGENFMWVWFGTHGEYDRLVK